MIFWELIGNPSQNQWDFLNIDGDTPLAGMYGIPTCRNILRITLREEISPISGESRPLLVWDDHDYHTSCVNHGQIRDFSEPREL